MNAMQNFIVTRKPLHFGALLFLVSAIGTVQPASAQLTSSNFALTPPLITETAPPNVMLVMSNDHELYKKAYSDFSDIDGDGFVDGSYDDTFTYSGYFDSNFCYDYDATDTRYEPVADISSTLGTTGHSCAAAAGDWSGNFLNWATMTRMDIVRHVLFGGARVVDTATSGATAGVTVLERAFLPEDVHSFVKVFAGDTEKYTPVDQDAVSLCSITYGAANNAPVLRVAHGPWPLWASSEVVQCHYRDEQDSGLANQPNAGDRPGTYSYDVQVQVCVAGLDASGSRCKPYPSGVTGDITYKPIGILQKYGDNSTINFGLLTGSYNKKIAGGVLRKNIVPLTGNSTASLNEINLNNGTFLNQGATDAGIINTISRFRIVSWDYANNQYSDCSTFGISIPTFMTSADADRQCRNWGNPLSEIYLEALRYFTGDDVPTATAGSGLPTAAFNTSDAALIPSLPQQTWLDPLTSANSCASCSIIVLSTGLNSFDTDDLASVSSLWSSAGATRMTEIVLDGLVDEVGDLEGISGGSYLIGENGTTNDGNCTAKTITDFSAARGICPEIGSLQGGFDIAGLAYHAYTSDLRNDYAGLQSVSTYSVALAENLPSYQLDVNGKSVTFAPTCQAHTTGTRRLDQSGWTDCSFVDAKIESQTANGGRMYIAWEDSLWGNDFDMDAVSRLEWCIGTDTSLCPGTAPNAAYGSGYSYADFDWKTTGLTADTIQFRTSSPLANAGNAIKLGFSISGVASGSSINRITNTPDVAMSSGIQTSGGKYVARGTQGNGEQFFLLRQGGYTISRLVNSSGNRIIYHEPLVYTASAAVTAGKLLENPLYFTAKYGSFNDIDGDGTPKYDNSPSDTREWDARSVDGSEVPDGIPDNFFPITNPNQLSDSLSQVFEIIAARISSGTAAAVVANSSTGLGSVYQAYYHPQYTDDNNATITWGGVLHSMFIDASGRFREDRGVIGKLESPMIDYIVDIEYDETVNPNRTRFQRYTQSDPALAPTPTGTRQDLEDFGSIWNARDVLADIPQADMILQRNLDVGTGKYAEDAGTKRYIFTYLDSPSVGTVGAVDAGEVLSFTHANFDATNGNNNFRYLGLSDSGEASNLVKYIRGQDVAGWRSRLVDIPGDGTPTPKHWVLGDIVHSSPLVVNPPTGRYDLLNSDATYAAFKQQYERRRQMIYSGGNDGMLHAFNGGVWDPVDQTFHPRAHDAGTGLFNVGQSHELGAEMWAYVPTNLLPHLQWLKEQNYPHVYYVDAPPQSFDVNIFPDDDVHPNGWGTILVVGMRLGGGDFPLDLDGDAIAETTMSSAFVVLDITDPERPPELLAELSAADLGYTTSLPTVIKARIPSAAGSYANADHNRWVLVFGSGPDTLSTAVSNGQDARIYAYDLVARELVTIHADAQTPAANPSGFFGDFRAVDWQEDMVDDVIYVGTVEGTEVAPSGRLKRIVLSGTAAHMGLSTGAADMSDVLNLGQPLSSAANIQLSAAKNERWLLFGTGRLFTSVDNRSVTQQSYYGVKEPVDYNTSAVTLASLVDSTIILVETDGDLHNGAIGQAVTRFSTALPNFNTLYNFMDTRPGWVHKMAYNAGDSPSERIFNTSQLIGSTVVFTSYVPSVDLCIVEGDSFLYALNFRTGTAEVFAPIGELSGFSGIAAEAVVLGQGAASAPAVIVSTESEVRVDGTSGGGDVSVLAGLTTGTPSNTSFGPPPYESGRISWEQLEIPF